MAEPIVAERYRLKMLIAQTELRAVKAEFELARLQEQIAAVVRQYDIATGEGSYCPAPVRRGIEGLRAAVRGEEG